MIQERANLQLLLENIKDGHINSYERVFHMYYPRLKAYAMHFILDADEAQDIVQECFITLWERRKLLITTSLSSLLFVMVRNRCFNHLRHEALISRFPSTHIPESPGSEALYQLNLINDAEHELLYNELRRQIDDVLDTLPERSKQIFTMSRLEGMKNREIAEQLGISIKVVERHISRALSTFKDFASNQPDIALILSFMIWGYGNY
ncbi:RNA polymerase sigma-70 factor [Prevotella sp. S7 MS 2]|uniref:RNA polymerase sigma-70 factor n=1 Tax=Prevotella sp. S7 MS 2 TaxID=1287488 RepID=UPI00068CC3A9|nr:RNA polymerase sigma-70 factor [Prevotella sp. S7 MS 2]